MNFPQIEEKILKFWKRHDILKKSLNQRKGNQPFVFFEGPPTANAAPGIHHVLARVFKDIILRYKTMRGFYVERKAGWDTHGLPVEIEVEKELGLKNKKQIEKYGIDKFNKKCKESVWRYKNEWEKLTDRIAFWLDLKNPYITYENDYIESVWWIIKQIWEKGLLYKDYKVVPYCPRCGTSLSSHEVAQGYETVKENSIYVKFPVKREKNTYLLVWTTTPWTLPGNVAIAINPDAIYVKVTKDKKEYLILAEERLSVLEKDYKVIEEIKAKDLVGKEYKPLYSFLPFKEKAHYVAAADFVSLEDGTGLVHIAPAFGEDDLVLGQRENLPIIQPVDVNGHLIKEAGEFAGMFVKDADLEIAKDLRRRNLLYKEELYQHEYPFCWRCNSALLYYAKTSWFIKMTVLRKQLLANNEHINWIPDYLKHGRFGEWLREVKDWNFSRERFWGTPLPIWECGKCQEIKVVASVEELGKKIKDLHRPYIDKIVFGCPKCDSLMRRVPEVIDAWFDSGSMPYAQWHYPFGNRDKIDKGQAFPGNFICEGVDQTRGWFYTLLAISTLLDKGPAYKNVISLGHVLDAKGQKMSKSKGNVVKPMEVIGNYGADVARWYFYTINQAGDSKHFDFRDIKDKYNRFFGTFFNTYIFLKTYLDKSFKPQENFKSKNILDRWIISFQNSIAAQMISYLESYDVVSAARVFEGFVDDLSNWYIRRSRRRFQMPKTEKEKNEAAQTLYNVLFNLARLVAPFTPFISEEIYQNLVCSIDPKAPESVHLTNYPKADEKLIDKKLNEEMRLIRDIVTLGLAIRAENKVRVRQPLSQIAVVFPKEKEFTKDFLVEIGEILITEELNIKKVIINPSSAELKKFSIKETSGLKVGIDLTITDELKKEGLAREIIRQVQDLRKQAELTVKDQIILYWDTKDSEVKDMFKVLGENIASETHSKEINPAAAGQKTDVLGKDVKVDGKEVWIGLEKIKDQR